MNDLLDKLNSDYIKNVLPHLFKSTTQDNLTHFQSGFGPGSYDIKLDIKSILECAPEYKPTGKNFIHFTSLRSLHSILNDVALRMYDLTGMNDPREFEFIAKDFGYNKVQLKNYKKHTHVFSMSPVKVLDSNKILTLWRLYGNEGYGCAIEFEIEDQFQTMSYIKMANINYSKPDYTKFFKANAEFEERNMRKVDLKGLIQVPACLHKDPNYNTESEIRLFHENGWQRPEETFEENSIFGFDINSKNQIVSFHKVELYNELIGYPNIKIKRIQLGFHFPEEQLQIFKKHIEFLYIGIRKKLGKKINIPKVEISPLQGVYH